MWRDRRLYALVCLGIIMGWCYRRGLRHFGDDPGGWMAFVTVWLPTAVLLALFVAYGYPALRRWWGTRTRGGR
jgi:hypothetical protein